MGKEFWKSKTLWANLIAIVGIFFGKDQIDPALTGQILAGINILLRFITKEPVKWS